MKRRDLVLDFTSLLDVIMILLFVVISNTGKVSAEAIEENNQLKDELEEKQQIVEKYEQQISTIENISDSYEVYQSQAIILTINNYRSNDQHILQIAQGEAFNDAKEIVLGINSFDNTRAQLSGYVKNVLASIDNQPIYIVYHLDSESIYKSEYEVVVSELEKLQKNNKEVFYKIVEE